MLTVKEKDDFTKLSKSCINSFCEEFGCHPFMMMEYITSYFEFRCKGKFIGGVYITSEDGKSAYIDRFFVDRKYQNLGYGTRMMDYIKSLYRYISVESIDEAVEFYRKNGFKVRKHQDTDYGDTVMMHITVRNKRKNKHE